MEALRGEVRKAEDALQEVRTMLSDPNTSGSELYLALIRVSKATGRAKTIIQEAAGG